MILKKKDWILIALLLGLAAACFLFKSLLPAAPAVRAEVSVDGDVVAVLDLSRDQEYTVSGTGGGTNLLIVEDGTIRCQEASCPDKVCVSQGRQKESGSSIVCLPNRMIVTVIG